MGLLLKGRCVDINSTPASPSLAPLAPLFSFQGVVPGEPMSLQRWLLRGAHHSATRGSSA
jgi:hypothetical protein